MTSLIRHFLSVVPVSNGRFQAVAIPEHSARRSREYDTEAAAQAYIDGYEARDNEDGSTGDEQEIYVTAILDEVEFMGPMPEQHGRLGYGPFGNLEVAKYHARTLSSDPNEGVVLPIRRPD